jgi:outer membrane lipoprotein SlyB
MSGVLLAALWGAAIASGPNTSLATIPVAYYGAIIGTRTEVSPPMENRAPCI